MVGGVLAPPKSATTCLPATALSFPSALRKRRLISTPLLPSKWPRKLPRPLL
jgi:hypothetical protein